MNCHICNSAANKCFEKLVLSKYEVNYWECPNCGFVFTDTPFWLEESYQSSIVKTDYGVLSRAIRMRYYASALLYFVYGRKSKCLDYGAGYGSFVRGMRDLNFEFYWYDKYTKNIFANDFDYEENNVSHIDFITSFEVFEHVSNPIAEIEKLLQISRNIFFTTLLIPNPTPQEWWYYGEEHGQHISFYRKKTFEFIARKYSLNFYSNGEDIHLLTEKKLTWIMQKMLFNSKMVRIIYGLFIR